MCLAVPSRILEIHTDRAKADFGGVHRTISIQLMPDVKVGDYVLVHTGFAIGKVDPKEAELTLKLVSKMGDLSPVRLLKPDQWGKE